MAKKAKVERQTVQTVHGGIFKGRSGKSVLEVVGVEVSTEGDEEVGATDDVGDGEVEEGGVAMIAGDADFGSQSDGLTPVTAGNLVSSVVTPAAEGSRGERESAARSSAGGGGEVLVRRTRVVAGSGGSFSRRRRG